MTGRSIVTRRSEVAVVFGAAHRRGGVERVVWELLQHAPPELDPVFVGGELEPGPASVRHLSVPASSLPNALGLLDERRRSGAALRDLAPAAAISAGANCPAGDVLLVGSVHRAWLGLSHGVTFRGRAVPGWVRRAQPWHVAMLELERRYFASSRYRTAVAVSNAVADELRSHYDVTDDRIRVIPNGYSATDFSLEQRALHRDAVRSELEVRAGEIVLLLVANELHRKGLTTILHAMARAGDDRFRLEIVGRAPIDAFAPVIESLGLTRRVAWRGPTSEVARYYAAADLLLLPAAYEPFGLVVVEALATGTPVIVSRGAGAADAIVPGENGALLDEPDDADELAAVLSTAGASGVLERWSAAAGPSVTRFEWTGILAQLWGLAADVVDQPG